MTFSDWSNAQKNQQSQNGTLLHDNTGSDGKNKPTFTEWSNANHGLHTKVDQTYIDKFITDTRTYIDKAQSDYKALSWQSAADGSVYQALERTEKDLTERSRAIRSYLDTHKEKIDSGAYTEFLSYLDSFDSARNELKNSFHSAKEQAARFSKEQDYLDWKKEQAQIADWYSNRRSADEIRADIEILDARITNHSARMQELIDQANTYDPGTPLYQRYMFAARGLKDEVASLQEQKALLQEEDGWREYFGWADYAQAKDFAKNNRYAGVGSWDAYLNSRDADGVYEYLNDQDGFRDKYDEKWAQDAGMAGADGSYSDMFRKGYSYITKEELEIYNYLYATQGKAKAEEYLQYISQDLKYKRYKDEEEGWKRFANESPVTASVMSVLTSPMKGVSYAGQLIDYAVDGEIDPYASHNIYSQSSSTIRQTVSDKIAKGNWGQVGSFLYNTGMSMGDFLITGAVTGGNQGLSLAIMGSGAAADTTLDALNRGLSSDQAILLGTIAGATEVLTEKISIDALLNKTGLGKNALGYVLQNLLAEGGEEGISNIANTLADVLISKDKSQWQLSINAYMENEGLTETEAFAKALADQAASFGLDVLGGMLSGAAMGGGSAAISTVQAADTGNKLGKLQLNSTEIQKLINTGLAADSDTRANYLAQRLQQKMAAGEELTNFDLGRLYQANAANGDAGLNLDAVTSRKLLEAVTAESSAEINTENAKVTLETPNTNVDEQVFQQAKRLSAVTGREIVFYTRNATAQGVEDGYHENGVLHINTESQNPLAQIVAHELTHSVESSDFYGKLSQLVLNRLQDTGRDIETLRQAKKDFYARNGEDLKTQEQIDAEIVAEYVSKNLLTNEAEIREMAQRDSNLARRILNWLHSLLAKLGGTETQERAFIRQATDLYAAALRQTQSSFTPEMASARPAESAGGVTDSSTRVPLGRNDNVVADNNTADRQSEPVTDDVAVAEDKNTANQESELVTDGNANITEPRETARWWREYLKQNQDRLSEEDTDAIIDKIIELQDMENAQEPAAIQRVSHSISPTFAAEIDNWDGKSKRVFNVGSTSEALMSIGVRNQGITWHSGKITKIMRDHSAMTKDVIKQVPKILEHPVAVLASKQADSRLVIFGTVNDANGDPVTAILELQPTTKGGQLMDMTVIASAYGKEGNVARFVESSGLVYLDPNKNRTESWMQSVGLQLPSDATAFGSIGRVTYPDGKVKIESIPYDQYMRNDADDTSAGSRQHSFSEPIVRKQDVAADLRAILNRGSDPAELRRYVERMERGTGNAEQNNGFSEQDNESAYHNNGFAEQTGSEAEQILRQAQRLNMGVEEYLEQNWEHYDVDGQWNDAAQQALELERDRSGRQYSYSKATDPEKTSIKEQLSASEDRLNNMDPVADVTVPTNLTDNWAAYNWAIDLLQPTGYRVDRQNFGTIWFDKDDINYGLNYADTPEERAALALLPRVLKRGIEVGRHGNHKLRQKETVTFAAPAIVNGTRVNMAAVVTVRNGRYYAHRIALPDGSIFRFSEQKIVMQHKNR